MKPVESILFVLASTASAFAPPPGHEYRAAGAGDVRSPCPGLNALANHGWLNRNGKDISVPQLVSGGFSGLGIGQDFMVSIGELALFAPPKPNFRTFNLDELKEHSFPIEHDVSLTRKDFFFNKTDSSFTFFQPYYDEFISYYDGLEFTTVESSARARENRINFTLANNPERQYGPIAFSFGYGETGLYTMTMGSSPFAQQARVDYVKSLMGSQNRLPYELGWQPSKIPITLLNLGQYALTVFNSPATTQKAPIAVEVLTRGFFAQAIQSQLVLARRLNGITGSLLG